LIVSNLGRCAIGILAGALTLAGCGSTPLPNPPAAAGAAQSRVVNDTPYESLYSFKGPPDGEQPQAALSYFDGKLYGTTNLGGFTGSGCNACGTVFHIGTTGDEKVLYRFGGAPDGAYPESDLAPAHKHAYYVGTTYSGGSGCSGTCGTIFKITPKGHEHVLYSFKGGTDGSHPKGGVLFINSNLYYGTTWSGGASNSGTVYVVQNTDQERVLHSFAGESNDGAEPVGDLVLIGSTLYGVTEKGGAYDAGAIFEISTSGSGEQILHSFRPKLDGSDPVGIFQYNGTLYGATSAGAAFSRGAIFTIAPRSAFHILYNFKGYPDDGAYPEAPPIVVKGKLYGTTRGGGADGNGIVYKMTMDGAETVLYSFHKVPDGVAPYAPLTFVNGVLYGTTMNGGTQHAAYGTVFRLLP
jgi:uncharacterized repeat protein (TIGR03803 family)